MTRRSHRSRPGRGRVRYDDILHVSRRSPQLRAEGHEVRDEDVARLSPLGTEHVNVLGRYHFELSEPVARGELRPLRDPAAPDEG
ncbi:MAG: Tn3 family transposase [Bacteroidota bacterium]